MDSGWLSQGKETEQFEKELADYIGCKHMVCVNNGTSALLTAILALNPAKVVAVPTYTFPATWNAVIMCGKIPHFCPVDPHTFLMKPPAKPEGEDLSEELLMPVSIAGLPLNPEDWKDRWVLEDGCEALGSEVAQRRTGSMWTSCFSFHSAKLLSTVEGGAVATNDDQLDYDLRLIRSHGERPGAKYLFDRLGLNLRTTDVASAIGRVQLRKLPQSIRNRRHIAEIYRSLLGGVVGFQEVQGYVSVHSNMFFPVLVDEPDRLAVELTRRGIETRRPWPPYSEFPDAKAVYDHVLAIPIYNAMTEGEALYVADAVKESLQ